MNEWMFGHIHLYSFFFQILQACYNQWKNMFFLIFCWFSYITSHPYPIHSFKTEPYSLSLWFWFFYFVTGFHCLLTLLHFISFIQLLSVKSSSSSSLSILALTTILINDDDDDVDIQIGEGKKRNSFISTKCTGAFNLCMVCVFSVDNSATKHLHVNYLDIHWTFTTGFFHYYYSTWICWLAATYSIFCLEWKRIV